jgi:hypothetical protein
MNQSCSTDYLQPQLFNNSNIFLQGGDWFKLHFSILNKLLEFVEDQPNALLRLYYDCAELSHTDELYKDAQEIILHLLINQILDIRVFERTEICYHNIALLSQKEVALLYHTFVIRCTEHVFTLTEKEEQLSIYTHLMWNKYYTHLMWNTNDIDNHVCDEDGYIKKEEMNIIQLLEYSLENGHNDLIRFLQQEAFLVSEFNLLYIYLKRNHHKNELKYNDKERAQLELLELINYEGLTAFVKLIKYAIAGVRQEFTDEKADFENYVNPNLEMVKLLLPTYWGLNSQFDYESADGLIRGNALEYWHEKQNYTFTWYDGKEIQFPYEKNEYIRDYLESLL